MGTYTKDYIDARIEEIEEEKDKFLGFVIGLENWLEVAALDRSVADRGVFETGYQTADMKTEIIHVLNAEIEALRGEM